MDLNENYMSVWSKVAITALQMRNDLLATVDICRPAPLNCSKLQFDNFNIGEQKSITRTRKIDKVAQCYSAIH